MFLEPLLSVRFEPQVTRCGPPKASKRLDNGLVQSQSGDQNRGKKAVSQQRSSTVWEVQSSVSGLF